MKLIKALLVLSTCISSLNSQAQMVPGEFEQIDYLITFGKSCPTNWGDDDYSQTFFFIIPKTFSHPIYIRVFDPDVGGLNDQPNGNFDTKTKFELYGGVGAYSNPDARTVHPTGNYKSGNLLATKTFGIDDRYDNEWYAFGPINPLEGEFVEEFDGYVIKIIAEGVRGNDGNLYKYFLSTQHNANKDVEGANAFTYEYSFRLPEDARQIVHLYPFIEKNVVSIKQHNFDLDDEAQVMLYSVSKNRHKGEISGNDTWTESKHQIDDEEKNSTMDIQILKSKPSRNDVVAYVTNQYDEAVAFFSNPIGGPPKYKYKVNVKRKGK
ncbi:MAG: hypothetical protein AAGC88_04865 [Bacteroidota bacterium]